MLRDDFPFFKSNNLIYFDNAATSQKPYVMIDALNKFYSTSNCNIHRGDYPLSRSVSKQFDEAREAIADYIGAKKDEIVFTSGATEGINLVTTSLLKDGNGNVVVSELEHSSNYFPWKESGLEFRVCKVDKNGRLIYNMPIDENTKIVSITGMSNVNGFCPDINKITNIAHDYGAMVLVDATQLVVHKKIDVKKIDCDFLVFSAHKLYGPMGLGVLYIKSNLIKKLNLYKYGGGAVNRDYSYKQDNERFEAGTQNIAAVLAFKESINYLNKINIEEIEADLYNYLINKIKKVKGITLYENSNLVMSFSLNNIGSYDIGVLLSNYNIAARCGGHCAYPLLDRIGEDSLCRISLSFYNTKEEIDYFIDKLNLIAGI